MEDLTTESNRLVKTSMAKNTWLTCKAAFESFNQRKQQQGTDDEVIKQWGCKYIYINTCIHFRQLTSSIYSCNYNAFRQLKLLMHTCKAFSQLTLSIHPCSAFRQLTSTIYTCSAIIITVIQFTYEALLDNQHHEFRYRE